MNFSFNRQAKINNNKVTEKCFSRNSDLIVDSIRVVLKSRFNWKMDICLFRVHLFRLNCQFSIGNFEFTKILLMVADDLFRKKWLN